jgi:hypothetical protein
MPTTIVDFDVDFNYPATSRRISSTRLRFLTMARITVHIAYTAEQEALRDALGEYFA